MSNINFTNSNNLTRQFTTDELDNILTDLNAKNSYYQSSQNNLIFIRLTEGYLLLIDLNSNTNRKLFELYSFNHAVDNPHQLKLIQNNSANEFTINDALLSVGYVGTVPIASLESIFMKMYIKTGTSKLVYSQSETDTLLDAKQNLIQVNDLSINQINLLQGFLDNKRDIVSSYSKTDIDTLFSNIIGGAPEALDTLNEIAQAINNDSDFYQQVVNKIGLETLQSNDAETLLNIKATDTSQFRIRVSSGVLSIQKYDNIDTWQTLLSITVDESNNAQMLLGGLNIVNLIDTKANISDVYTKTQSDTLLNNKQNIINDGDLTIARTSGLQTALDSKANQLTTYTKTETNTLINNINPSSGGISSTALKDYATPEEARNANLERWSLYRTGNQVKLNSYFQQIWAYKSINSSVSATGINHNNLVFTIEGSFLWDRHGGGPVIINATFKNNETTVGNILLEKNGGGNIEMKVDNVISTLFNDVGQLNNNEWHKIVISHDPTNGLHGWINGTYKAPTSTQILPWINFNKVDLQLQQITEGFGETASVRFSDTNIYNVGSSYIMDMLIDVLPSTKLLINEETARDISGNDVSVSYVNTITSRLLPVGDLSLLSPLDQEVFNVVKLSSENVGINLTNATMSDAPLTVSGTWNNYFKTYKHVAIGETTLHEQTTPTGHMALRMCSAANGVSQIHFGRVDDNDFNGAIYYTTDNKMLFFVNNNFTEKMCICPQTVMLPELTEASDDQDANTKNIPRWGIYRTGNALKINISLPIKTDGIVGFYDESTLEGIASFSWNWLSKFTTVHDVSGYINLLVQPSFQNVQGINGKRYLQAVSQTTDGIFMTNASGKNNIKSLVYVINHMNTNPNNMALLSDPNNGGNFISPRGAGDNYDTWVEGAGSNVKVYYDGVENKTRYNTTVTNTVQAQAHYANKWTVIIFNDITLTAYGSLNFFAYSAASSVSAQVGYKVGAIIGYDTVLTPQQITQLTDYYLGIYSGS